MDQTSNFRHETPDAKAEKFQPKKQRQKVLGLGSNLPGPSVSL